MSDHNKVAIVTGAGTGIGRATALRLAQHGARVLIAARGKRRLDMLADELKNLGAEAMALKCDVSRLPDSENLVQQALAKFGRIDILINNAGMGISGRLIDSDPEQIKQMLLVNVLGVYHMSRAVLPNMIALRNGHIVNLGSIAGLKYSPGFAMYSATKFAVRAFSEALRNEVQEYGIRVTLIHPGMTNTALLEAFGASLPVGQGDMLQPEDIAETICFALTRPASTALNELTIRPRWQVR